MGEGLYRSISGNGNPPIFSSSVGVFQLTRLNILASERGRCLAASLRGSNLLGLLPLSLEEKLRSAVGAESEGGRFPEVRSCRCIPVSPEEPSWIGTDLQEAEL